jgi:hypothetical protein
MVIIIMREVVPTPCPIHIHGSGSLAVAYTHHRPFAKALYASQICRTSTFQLFAGR